MVRRAATSSPTRSPTHGSPVRGRRTLPPRSASATKRATSVTKKSSVAHLSPIMSPRSTGKRVSSRRKSRSRSRSPMKAAAALLSSEDEEGSDSDHPPSTPTASRKSSAFSSRSSSLATRSSSSSSTGGLCAVLSKYGLQSKSMIRFYLIIYNMVMLALWSCVYLHWCRSVYLDKMMETLFGHGGLAHALHSLPSGLARILNCSWWHQAVSFKGVYDALGFNVGVIQSLALLEILHAFLGWVPSNPIYNAFQIGTRLFVIWFIVILKGTMEVKHHCSFAVLIYVWSVADIVRYTYYLFNLLKRRVPKWLAWARYSFFLVLYPLGVGSEILLILTFLRTVAESAIPCSIRFALGLAIYAYLPGFYYMYDHMLELRRKNAGSFR